MANAAASVIPAEDLLLIARWVLRNHADEEAFLLERRGDRILYQGSQSGPIAKLMKWCTTDTLVVRVPAELRERVNPILIHVFPADIPRVASIRVGGTFNGDNYGFLVLVMDGEGIEHYLTVARSKVGRRVVHFPPLPGSDRLSDIADQFLNKPDISRITAVIHGDWALMYDLFRSENVPLSTKFLSALWMMCPWIREWVSDECAVYETVPEDLNWGVDPTRVKVSDDVIIDFYCNLFYFSIGYLYSVGDNILQQVCKRFNTALISSGSSTVSQDIFNNAIISKFVAGTQSDPNITEALGRAVATEANGAHNQWVTKDRLGAYPDLMGEKPYSQLDEQFFIQLRMVAAGYQQTSINLVVSLLPVLTAVEKGATGDLETEFSHAWGLKVALTNRPFTNVVRNIHPNFQINMIPQLVILAQAYYTRRDVNDGRESTWAKFKSSESAAESLDVLDVDVETMKSLSTALPRIRLDKIAGWAQNMDPTVINTILENINVKAEQLYAYMIKHGLTGPWFRNHDFSEKKEYIRKGLQEKVNAVSLALESDANEARLNCTDHNKIAYIDRMLISARSDAQQIIAKLLVAYEDTSLERDPKIAAANGFLNDIRNRAATTVENYHWRNWDSYEDILATIEKNAAYAQPQEEEEERRVPAFFDQFRQHVAELRED